VCLEARGWRLEARASAEIRNWKIEAENEKWKNGRRCLALAAADEGNVLVVQFAGDAPRPRLASSEFYFADQAAAPGFIDARAELALHALELLLPGLAVGGDFEAAVFAAQGARVRGQRFTHDRWPRAREPREGRFGAFESAQRPSEKISRSFHWPADSSTSESAHNADMLTEMCRVLGSLGELAVVGDTVAVSSERAIAPPEHLIEAWQAEDCVEWPSPPDSARHVEVCIGARKQFTAAG
jgi:hypothetical protein